MSLTPANLVLTQGTYIVTIASRVPNTPYIFLNWQDGDTNPTKNVTLNSDTVLTATMGTLTS